MRATDTLSEIEALTANLVGLSLSNEQNFPSTHGDPKSNFEITVKNAGALTVALRNVSYRDIYSTLSDANCFNMKLLDGALVCLRYRFEAGKLVEHNLGYFPSPDLEQFQNEPEIYLSDDIYADIVERNIVPFPIRFDFNADEARYVDVDHPYSHLTLGQYKNCRIPVCSPVSPLAFGGFILRNFYNTVFRKFSDDIPAPKFRFAQTISPNEQKIPHVVLATR
ncbi:DUF2290 domain-containing protein [Chlorobaculum limnaeum]|uniref:DUF2290 domain-containing protein n=1 Tax=Chlorobaculum limnaeum TaxID=274537 RepID=UPI000A05871A|nr:DUF2290 domain-containing protein [Chlorobaculum limnaeum]